MISVDEACAHIDQHVPKSTKETVSLAQALDRVVAEPIVARITQPSTDCSAMDGYAVRHTDASNSGARLQVVAEAPAGKPYAGAVGPSEAVRVFTGSVIPPGTDHVIIQEEVETEGTQIVVTQDQPAKRHIRRAGIDFQYGDLLVEPGQRIGPAHVAIAAASNHAEIPVFRRLRVGVLASGDELRRPGERLEPGQIVNSNTTTLSALIQRWGGEPIDLGITADTPSAIADMVTSDQAKQADIIVPIGGASVGDHDHMRSTFAEIGAQPIFEKVAVKPGKPTWFSTLGHQKVLGLPGNPASAYVCAHLFLYRLLQPKTPLETLRVPLAQELEPNGPRETFLRAVYKDGAVNIIANQDSSLLSPFVGANGLVRRRPFAEFAPPNDEVDFLPLTT